MRIITILMIGFVIFGCKKQKAKKEAECQSNLLSYYSDYFVFISNDNGAPLVVPVDLNWTPTTDGYSSEFKAWYGTNNPWPIAYLLSDSIISACDIPNEPWEHGSNKNFQFSPETQSITVSIDNAPKMILSIPDSSRWIQSDNSASKNIYGCKTVLNVNSEIRQGWLIYERIRRSQSAGNFGDFSTFYWLPLVINDELYHFEQHGEKQLASHWKDDNGLITVESIPSFELNVLGIISDSISGRNNIPDTMQIIADLWNINVKLKSGGNQTGYGGLFPNGLAYYRQSLVSSLPSSTSTGFGLLELILEND